MKANYSDAQIEHVIQNHYPGAGEILILSGGLVSQTFSFTYEGKKMIFQIGGKKEAYEKERYVGETYKGRLPVRVMRGVFVNADGRAYCFSDFIGGRKLFDLNPQEQIDVVPSVLDFMDRLSVVDIPNNAGCGRFDASGRARFSSWQAFISAVGNEELYAWRQHMPTPIDLHAVDSAVDMLRTNADCLRLERACLLHGDIGSYNLLADGVQISGAIDWGLALYGDPLYDMANVLFWNEDKLQPLVAAIKNRFAADDHSKTKLQCYMIRIGLEEIYNTAVLGEIGYDDAWVMNRLKEVTVRV